MATPAKNPVIPKDLAPKKEPGRGKGIAVILLLAAALAAGFLLGRAGKMGLGGASPAKPVPKGVKSAVITQWDPGMAVPLPAPPLLSPAEKTQRLKQLLTQSKKEAAGKDFNAAARDLREALELDPKSRAAKLLSEELAEKRKQAQEDVRRGQLEDDHAQGEAALDRKDFEAALKIFQTAWSLKPGDPKTFRLVEKAYRLRDEMEMKKRRQAYREGSRNGWNTTPFERPPAGKPQAPRQEGASPGTAEQEPMSGSRPEGGEYTVQPEDVLQVTVFEEPDLTTKVRVIRTGEITYPLLGKVRVAGMTVDQVQEKLTELLERDYLVHPQVQVFIDKPRNVFVSGQVHRPGSYPVSVEKATTVMEVISLAGGFTQDADLNGTRIIRMENGQKKTLRVRLADVVNKGDKGQDTVVQPEDIVFVPESFF